jgi:inner membrane protein
VSPGSHLLASWLLANSVGFEHRERRIVALAGLAPDLDGIGYLADRFNEFADADSFYYLQYHHIIAHNLLASVVIASCAAFLSRTRRAAVFAASVVVTHLHFLCDVLGSKGPDGYQWPILYLYPFNQSVQWVWSGQWELSAWQNVVITLTMIAISAAWSVKQRYSFVEVISEWLDREFFKIVARRIDA